MKCDERHSNQTGKFKSPDSLSETSFTFTALDVTRQDANPGTYLIPDFSFPGVCSVRIT